MLAPFWTNPRVKKICPGLKETLLLLRRAGTELQGPRTDPSLASYLLNPGRASHGVEDLSEEFLGESVSGRDPLHSLGLEAQAAFRLAPLLEAEVRKRELLPLLEEVEIPLSEVLAKMEFAGIRVDPGELEALSNLMKGELLRLTREIHRLAGEEFNINSPRQLGPILFEKLKLPVVKRTKTGASTDEEVLRRLSKRHPLPGMILEYREMYKLRSTYVEALPKLIDPTTGRIHTSFNQTVTATGRLSSSDPNLQNIPIRTPLGRQIRKAFVPSDPGKAFLAADYSQIELRILAHLSEDEALTAAFQAAQDIHRVTAAEVFHLPEEKVDGAQRSAAKAINFGIVYGMTPFGLAKELGVDPPEAQEFIERYFSRYPGVKRYLDRVLEQAREKGYCTTLLQRRRYIPELHSKDLAVRQFAERTALNAPIQGSAADLIKLAMVSIDRKITEEGLESRMLLQVHDELIFEVPRGELEEISAFVRQAMESPSFRGEKLSFRVPIEVKLTAGSNWLEASHG
ncbi:MAG: DNA polymerase I [Candidatus Omnitrophica bacterium]|nr:DNA polymerase I [Candidatus Omnitrophota bacterium]